MTKVGFIGLGIMGVPMVKNLLKAGIDVTIIANGHGNKKAIQELLAQGVKRAPTAKETAAGQDVVITMLPNGHVVADILDGPDGLLAGLEKGAVLIDSSSVAPEESKRFAALAAAKGADFLDAPVSGGEPGAIAGTLAFMVGGSPAVFERMYPLFMAMGASAVLTGPAGSGSTTKLCNQIICFVNTAAVSEAFILAQKAGADPKKVYEAIRGGLAGSAILEQKAARMYTRNFVPGGSLASQHKDLGNVMDTARTLNVPLPLTALVQQFTASLMQAGLAAEDNCTIVKFYEAISGVTVQTQDKNAD